MQHSLSKKIFGLLLLLALAIAVFNSCGDETFWHIRKMTLLEVKITAVTIQPAEEVEVEVGKTTLLTAIVTPDNATDPTVIWSSLDPDIASVDEQTGLVTGLSAGQATICAMADDGSEVTACKSITVIQFELSVRPESYHFAVGGGTSSEISITSNTSWTVTSDAEWLTTSLSSGSNNNTFTITAAENTATSPRSASVTITGGEITRTVNVTQDEVSELSVLPESYNFVAGGGTSPTITVTSNQSWTVTSNTEWLTTSLSSGNNNNTFTMTATANAVTSPRSALVTIIGGGITRTINVTQDATAFILDVSPLTWNPAAGGGISSAITVTSNTSWTVSSNAAWLTTSLSSGNNNNIFTMTAAENLSTSSRNASVTITGGGVTRTLYITQDYYTCQSFDNPQGFVEINGVRWATRNVGASSPCDYGGYYQFNRGTTDFLLYEDYWKNSVYSKSDSWLPANDPSPAGYHVPTFTEIQSLVNTTYVRNEWITLNGVNGRKFTDKNSGNSIFLPAAGHRRNYDGTLDNVGLVGNYWSSTVSSSRYAYDLYFYYDGADWGSIDRDCGFSVRAVAD